MWRDIFTGKERRRYVRLPVELKADFKINSEEADGPWHNGLTRDISPEGMCLITDLLDREKWQEIMQRQGHLYLEIYYSAKDKIKAEALVQRIEVEAQVMWQRHENREGKELCLLGLHFTKIEKDSQDIIQKFILDNLIAKYHPA